MYLVRSTHEVRKPVQCRAVISRGQSSTAQDSHRFDILGHEHTITLLV